MDLRKGCTVPVELTPYEDIMLGVSITVLYFLLVHF